MRSEKEIRDKLLLLESLDELDIPGRDNIYYCTLDTWICALEWVLRED